MEPKRNNRNRATSSKTSNRHKKAGKIVYFPGLHDQPAIEVAEQNIPLTLKLCPDAADKTPTFVDQEYYKKVYTVDNGQTYTLRLGIHSSGLGVPAMDVDTIVACYIPTVSDKLQHIVSLFLIDELYPAKYMDTIWLKANADRSFKIEYVYGSAALEPNNISQALPLDNSALKLENDSVMIYQHGVRDKIPNCCTFFFDFLRIQIKVIYE
ncbi:MAG: hypothetical protein K1W27_03295 [Lachnospiraceae bacterium]|jgi:hypothetical protein